jgi:hypothetical protein
MYRTASIAAYDVLDQVFVACTVRLWDGERTEGITSESHWQTTVQGVGSSEDVVWLRDALVALLEAL